VTHYQKVYVRTADDLRLSKLLWSWLLLTINSHQISTQSRTLQACEKQWNEEKWLEILGSSVTLNSWPCGFLVAIFHLKEQTKTFLLVHVEASPDHDLFLSNAVIVSLKSDSAMPGCCWTFLSKYLNASKIDSAIVSVPKSWLRHQRFRRQLSCIPALLRDLRNSEEHESVCGPTPARSHIAHDDKPLRKTHDWGFICASRLSTSSGRRCALNEHFPYRFIRREFLNHEPDELVHTSYVMGFVVNTHRGGALADAMLQMDSAIGMTNCPLFIFNNLT